MYKRVLSVFRNFLAILSLRSRFLDKSLVVQNVSITLTHLAAVARRVRQLTFKRNDLFL